MTKQGLAADQLQNLTGLIRDVLGIEGQVSGGDVVVWVGADSLVSACSQLKKDSRLDMDYLACLSVVDYPDHFQAVYHLFSIRLGWRLVLKVKLPRGEPNLPSLVEVWPGATWHEREAAEMFGVHFAGHPHLVPLLLEEGFTGHPLLKSYVLPE